MPIAWPVAVSALGAGKLVGVGLVTSLREKFPTNTTDVEWLSTLGRESDWVVISQDYFRNHTEEREVIRLAGLTVFVLPKQWSSHPFFPRSAQFIRWWPCIVEQANSGESSIYELPWRENSKFRKIL